MKEKMKQIFKGRRLYYLIFFLLCAVLLHSYFWTGSAYPTGDDSLFHLSNIEALSSSLDFSTLKLIPSPIVPDIANNLGYGVGLFYPRLPHLAAAYITHIAAPFGLTASFGMKVTHFIVLFLSAVVMYQLVFRIWKKEKPAFFSAFFYITSSYTLSDIIIRDAFAECFLFLFLPMIFLGLYELFFGEKKKFYPWFILGYLGILNSHLVVSIFLTVAVVIYLLFHWKKVFTWDKMKHLLAAAGMLIILFLPSVIPMIEHKLYGMYAVFQESIMTTPDLVQACAVYPLSMLIPFYKWENIHFFIAITVLVLLVIVLLRRKEIFIEEGQKKMGKSLLWMAIIFFILTSKLTPWQYAPGSLLMIQFPWRLEIVVIFATSLLGGLYFLLPRHRSQKTIDISIIIITLLFAFVATIPLKNPVGEEIYTAKKMSEYGMGWSKEYLPMATFEKGKHYLYQENKVRVVLGEASITEEKNEVPLYSFHIETTEKATVEIPRLFYFGYQVKFKSQDKDIILDYKQNEYGLMEVEVPASGTITLTYPGTKIYQMTNAIRLVAVLTGGTVFLFYTIKTNKKNKVRQKKSA